MKIRLFYILWNSIIENQQLKLESVPFLTGFILVSVFYNKISIFLPFINFHKKRILLKIIERKSRRKIKILFVNVKGVTFTKG